jgi:Undecaprenyl-phosphate glucose phosphotransferase
MTQHSKYMQAAALGTGSRLSEARRSRSAIARSVFSFGAALAETAVIIVSALIIGFAYHYFALNEFPIMDNILRMGAVIALFMLIPNMARGEYVIGNFLEFRGHARRLLQLWTMAFTGAIILGFLTKTSDEFSRATVMFFYTGGYLALAGARYTIVRLVQIGSKTGLVAARRIFLIGFEDEIMAFAQRHQPWNLGMEIAGVSVIPKSVDVSEDAMSEIVEEAVLRARVASPDDVFILMTWDRKPLIDATINRFMTIPASIHLGAEAILDRFHDVRISRIGTVSSVQLVRRPLSTMDVAVKRGVDIIVGLLAVVLLAPLFLVVAIAIRLDSRGPIFFLQRRYGFNQQPFRIVKFRTMLTMDDGDVVRQATAHDPRITRVGRLLRKLNIDELPQLLNVIRGNMSLVGPRPHALAHDHEFERKIASYARRHNVKPGITGWAQVNGFRGETDTDEKMRNRVEYDLAYIDNWSMLWDMAIIGQTIISPKAYRNAK